MSADASFEQFLRAYIHELRNLLARLRSTAYLIVKCVELEKLDRLTYHTENAIKLISMIIDLRLQLLHKARNMSVDEIKPFSTYQSLLLNEFLNPLSAIHGACEVLLHTLSGEKDMDLITEMADMAYKSSEQLQALFRLAQDELLGGATDIRD